MDFDNTFHDHRTLGSRPRSTSRSGRAATADSDGAPAKPKRDWKRSVLIFGLGALSWVATYVGMLELIEANMGDLPIVHKIIIAFSVGMLMTMIIWLLDQLFKPHPFITKLSYAGGYVFLSLISIGFGFGFYWKVLESRSESSRSAESAVTQVQSSLNAASTRLEQLQSTLVQLTQISTEKAEIERTKGTSCPNSKPGDGPRRKMREDDAQRFSFASKFVEGRVSAVKGDMSALDVDLAKIVMDDKSIVDLRTGTRNEFMRGLSRKLDMTVTGFNAFRTDPQLRQIRTDLADRAERTSFGDPKGGMVSCPDGQLQTALRGVVKAIDQLPEFEKPQIAAVEGSEATIEAFRRLTTTFYGMLAFKLPPSADELRDLQKKAVQSVEATPPAQSRLLAADGSGLSKRDYVPLAVAVFVDLCLFLVSMVSIPANRLGGLVPKMQAAERGPVIQILSRFNDIHKDRQIRENFEIFRHVVFDMNGDYYVAVPLDAPPKLNPQERETLRVEAQLLANLFASFEQEKIFKRTLLPTTGSIQKRLKRQGSKFAGAEAFRVYKFLDGAWSDIILGAIMGAARRSEDEKQAMPINTARPFPLAPPARGTVMGGPPIAGPGMMGPGTMGPGMTGPRMVGPGMVGPGMMGPTMTDLGPQPQRPAPMPAPGPRMTGPGMSRPGMTGSATTGTVESMPPQPGRTDTGSHDSRTASRPMPRPASRLPVDPQHEARFGRYAQAFQPESAMPLPPRDPSAPQSPRVPRSPPPPAPEAEVTVKAANSNTAPAETESVAATRPAATPVATVVPVVRPQTPPIDSNAHTGGMMDVTLSRETATFSVPVGDTAMPASLTAAIAKARTAAEAHNGSSQHKLHVADSIDGDDADELPSRASVDDILTPADIALIGRMAPPAAE